MVDTPTSYGTDTGVGGEVRGNYCTWNPLGKNLWASSSAFTFSDGNLQVNNGTSYGLASGTIAVSSGKYYWEISFVGTVDPDWDSLGIVAIDAYDAAPVPGTFDGLYGYVGGGKKLSNSNGYAGSAYGAAYTSANVVGVAFDANNGTITFYKDGVSQGTAFTGISSSRGWMPYVGDYSNAVTTTAWIGNFGQRAFAYTAPSGYKCLVDTNLPTPTIAKGNTVMDVVTYTGSSGSQTISGLQFSSDLLWIKRRSSSGYHTIADTVRGKGSEGAYYRLFTNTTDVEIDDGYDVTAITSTGFTLPAGSSYANIASATFVAWAWYAGITTVSNTQGSITSQVRANASAGFSVVTYTANAPNNTIGHGLGIRPEFVITKARTRNDNWLVYHSALGVDKWLHLNITAAAINTSGIWGTSGNWTSNTFGVSTNGVEGNNYGSNDFVAYCFAPVSGYSSAFSYTGNGSSDGPFVYLGFRPRFIIQKRTDSAGSWLLIDTARDPVNVARNEMFANSSAAEYDNTSLVDVLSNGFKIRATFANMNASSGSFIGYAFAESPFQYARAR
jgi:hypothetical protein